ncbi:MAG: penicillin-binding transpeptidase domain-containing protein [Clostridium sp.]|uniref:penicillin-binding transpeptidase domain-containing protein n=1 Tax=Clostridium sp. TaxID=1506 RepID=UPI002A8337B2|nr:penicillin-binding transpeptidase domain-containing protein [Clostridium sp.]MCI6692580.1 penicillin-binding transpeptidase domain-containing protein [Clostridium sp.]MDY4251491.1 penicillin-binding transpeptidase domain-containing protein [Clostridium sp.]
MKLKKFLKVTIAFSFLIVSMLISIGCSGINKAEKTFNSFTEKWVQADYSSMYQMLTNDSKEYITEEDFISRYTNIFTAINANNLSFEIDGKSIKEDDVITIPFKLNMNSITGDLSLTDYKLSLVKEDKEYKIKWDESLIFPNMIKDDKVRVSTNQAKRGNILDRNGKILAEDGIIYSVGIYPANFNKSNIEAKVTEIANALDISEDNITTKLQANTNPEHFIPLVDILTTDPRINTLKNRDDDGILLKEKIGRIYYGGEAFGRLIGYIGSITAEELEANSARGYNDTSLIGKAGLEQVYEDTLRGEDAAEIYIEREMEKITIASKEIKNGNDIKLSVDYDLQNKVYSEMSGEKGAATAVNPKTGEVIAMVSAPSYDSNTFTTYISKTQKAKWEENNHADEINRFNKSYAPGSTMKLLTSIIGLENGVINPTEAKDIQGLKWQKDSSWGDYKVTRVIDPGKGVTLKDAANYSDNIYYAQVALDLGSEKFINGLKGFGIGEELTFEYPMEASQISNDGELNRDIIIADTGYGQGEVMVTPLHIALFYSTLSNEGNMMQPRLVISKNPEAKVWKEGLISQNNLPILIDAFTASVNDAGATLPDGAVSGHRVAGKSGTAEIKASQDDANGTENGWFVSTDPDSSKISISMIIENVKDRGGSHVTIPKVRNVMEYYLNR